MLGWCGIAAVFVANLVIASYVHMAWNENRNTNQSNSSNVQVIKEKRTD